MLKKSGKRKPGQRIYRLPPCPAYDIEGMESWLTDMASEGLLLVKDGFFAGIATFEYTGAQVVKYRLEAAEKSTSMWSDNNGEPDPEAVALSEKYSWFYIAKRGDFYIYRSFEEDARELNTDPAVQALALNAVKKRFISSALSTIFWTVLYPLCLLYAGLFITIVNIRTWVFLLGVILAVWTSADSVIACLSLSRLQKRLRAGDTPDTAGNRKKHPLLHHIGNASQLILCFIFIGILLNHWGNSITGEDKIRLDEYTGILPFATMYDFAGDDISCYRMTAFGNRLGFNTIKEWSDFLAPRNIEYGEYAEITRADGSILDGTLHIDYHETINPFIAKRLADEYYQTDKRKKHFSLLETPELNVDYAVAYTDIFPNIILQDGNIIIHAYFHESSQQNNPITLEEWTALIAESIKNNRN